MIDIPGYKIVRTLGRGGMACVYLAIQESFEREVALKVMNPALAEDPKFTARFLHEARVVSRLVHPNIVTVYDVGVQDNHHYLSMEYVPGLDLKHKRKFLTPPQSLQVIRDVARALDYASKKGYVHRDVKPENIMLHDEDGRAVLMDFGIACLADTSSGMTQTGTAIGTPHYMSPEQAKGRQVDSRSDIYSLGVVLFLLLTGHVPYDADSAVAVGIKHVQEDVPRLPGNLLVLQPIINKVLAKNPDDRYQSGADLVAAIDAVTDEDIEAIQLATKHYVSQLTAAHDAPTVSQQTVAAETGANPDQTAATQRDDGTGDRAELVTGDGAVANALSGRQRAIQRRQRANRSRAAAGASLEDPAAESGDEILAVHEDDRRDRLYETDQQRRWPRATAAAALIVASFAGSLYFRDYLPAPVAEPLDDFAHKCVEISTALTDRFAGTGSSAAEALQSDTVQRDIVVPASGGDLQSSRPEPQTAVQSTSPGTVQGADPLSSAARSDTAGNSNENPAQLAAEDDQSMLADGVMGARARSLRDELNSDLSVAPQLAQLYRDALAAVPGDRKAEWGLRELLDYHYRYIREALQARDLDQAQSYFESAQASFPVGAGVVELPAEDSYQRLRERFELAREAQAHIDEGKRYLAESALTAPSGENALESYRRALEIDPGNPLAETGVETVVDRLVQLAGESLESGDFARAAELVDQGLSIDGDNQELAELSVDATGRLERRAQIEQLTSRAQQQLDAGNLIAPPGESAYHHYRELLDLDPGNEDAARGIARVEQQLVRTIETHINRNQFEEARELLSASQNIYSTSERFPMLGLALDRAVEADFLSRQPRVSKILVSNVQPQSLGQVQTDTVNAERTIHIGFSYENFTSQTSVVQAMLYDGSRSVLIRQVPVVVSGVEGIKFFQIDRPVEGFSEGGYNIDLVLHDQRLSTLSFRVRRAQQAQSSQAAADTAPSGAISQ